MTGIKPPSGPKPPVSPAASEVGGASRSKAGSTFDIEQGQSIQSDAATQSVSSAQSTEQVSVVDRIGADLEAGRISASEAVDQIVQDMLDSPMAAKLNGEGRAALEVHLRQTLEDDPAFVAMVNRLG